VEIEGTRGALRWEPFDSRQPVYLRYDRGGQIVEEEVELPPRGPYTVMDHPLIHFYRKIKGLPTLANTGERAVDHFRHLRAVYDCAVTGEKRTIVMHPIDKEDRTE
jgi:predicted dehydrogenase